jgi:hypothetical protein
VASDAEHAVIDQDACCEGPPKQHVGDRRAAVRDSVIVVSLSIDRESGSVVRWSKQRM